MSDFAIFCRMKEQAVTRRRALSLYQSLGETIGKLEKEVHNTPPRVAIRQDRHIHEDLGVVSQIESMLHSFAPAWLRLGVETVFRRVIPEDVRLDEEKGEIDLNACDLTCSRTVHTSYTLCHIPIFLSRSFSTYSCLCLASC